MTDNHESGMSEDEFNAIAAVTSANVFNMVNSLMDAHAQTVFSERPVAAGNIAPFISGVIDGLVQCCINPADPADDERLKADLCSAVAEQIGQCRFDVMSKQAGAVGVGQA